MRPNTELMNILAWLKCLKFLNAHNVYEFNYFKRAIVFFILQKKMYASINVTVLKSAPTDLTKRIAVSYGYWPRPAAGIGCSGSD